MFVKRWALLAVGIVASTWLAGCGGAGGSGGTGAGGSTTIGITSSNNLPSGYAGTAYSQTLAASDSTHTGLTWAVTSGLTGTNSLATVGLGLAPTGTLTGIAPQAGTASFTATVTDSAGNTASASFAVTIFPGLSITTSSSLPSGYAGTSYSQTLSASGGTHSGFTWTVTSGLTGTNSLTSVGLQLASTGALTAIATLAGTANFTATVTDSAGNVASAALTVTIEPGLTVTTTFPPAADLGATYSYPLNVSGGTGTGYTWSLSSGDLANFGLSLSTAGVLSGTPTQSGIAGYTVSVTDSAGHTVSDQQTLTVRGALSLLPAGPNSLPPAHVGFAYPGVISGSGGSGNLSLTVASGPTPADGLTAAPRFNSTAINIAGVPTSPATVTVSVKLTDNNANASITQTYTIPVTLPTAPVLSTPSTSIPGSAAVGTAYTGSITAASGVGPAYSWTINNSVLSNNTPVSIGDGLSVSTTGDNTLSITGTPIAIDLSGVQFTASVNDNATGFTSGAQTYTVVVTAGQTISGTINLTKACGANGTLPAFTVGLYNGTTLLQSTTSSTNDGSYSFTRIPNGTYTIIPSIPAATSSLFYPTQYNNVVVNNTDTGGKNFSATVGYTVSGILTYNPDVIYGQTYVYLTNNNCGGKASNGTSIMDPFGNTTEPFTIRGVGPGSYTLVGWVDALGQGVPNATAPIGSAAVTVTTADVTNATVLVSNPASTAPTQSGTITHVFPTPDGVFIGFKPSTNASGIEDASSYSVIWSTDPTLSNGPGSRFANPSGAHCFSPDGPGSNLWILDNVAVPKTPPAFVSGTTYYFQIHSYAAGVFSSVAYCPDASGVSAGWSTYGASTPTGVVVGIPSCTGSCTTVSGLITIPSNAKAATGGALYAGVRQISPSGDSAALYMALLNSSTVGGSGNPYSVTVPSGTGYEVIGILSSSGDGSIQFNSTADDVTNLHNDNIPQFTAAGNMVTENLTLPSGGSTATVGAQYYSNTTQNANSTGYRLNLDIEPADKLPIAVTLTSSPNIMNPVDMSPCISCGTAQFQYSAILLGATPSVGDAYTFSVTYNDASTATVTGTVTAFGSTGAIVGANNLPTNLSPNGTNSSSLTPTFTWTWPTGAATADYNYSFNLWDNSSTCAGNSCNLIWQIPANGSYNNGFTFIQDQGGTPGGTSATGSIPWAFDPSGSGSIPSGVLNTNDNYSWQIQVQDSNHNQATATTWFLP